VQPVCVLGINAFHGDSSACVLRDGQLVAAVEEERFRRIKHWAGLPTEAMRYCLREAGIAPNDLAHIAINRDPRANTLHRLAFLLTKRPNLGLAMERLRKMGKIRNAAGINGWLQRAFPQERVRAEIHHVEHHRAHLTSAFLVSPFAEAACVSVDGFGDFASTAWGYGLESRIRIDHRVYFPHSLGIFYSALTQHLGFLHYGDEYKVMGLAAYGRPRYLDAMRKVLCVQPDGTFRLNLRFFRHATETVMHTWNDCAPEVGILYTPELDALLWPARKPDSPLEQEHKDLACSVQTAYEEAFFALLNAVYRRYSCTNLALAGGCAMNSVANGKISLKTPFRRTYLPPAAGDAGGAIGAAFAVWNEIHPSTQRFSMLHAYWGPAADGPDASLNARIDEIQRQGCEIHEAENQAVLCAETARAISQGKVIGWFQGRLEFGPRALGNRSILCDPRRADMKALLNAKIKRRESFRPFAPSILREAVADWFEIDDDVPFMMQVFQIRQEKRAQIPAVTHVDGSGRLQTVHKETNPLFHQLISEFYRQTSIPMVLNTSFNENEPVVCRAEEALDCFLRTKMDILVLGNHVIERRNGERTGFARNG
jgi:carbamoyltransferase